MTHEEVSRRVATRYLRAQDEGQGPPPAQEQQSQAPEAPQQQQALPQSGPGKANVKKHLDMLNSAFDEGDDEAFDKALDGLTKANRTRPGGLGGSMLV